MNSNNQGKGLESLIPKRQNSNNSNNNYPKPTPVEDLDNKKESSQESYPQKFMPPEGINKEEKIKGEAIFQIEIDKVKPNPYQPRKEYNQENLQDLANSIREVGIIQPLVASKVEEETENGTRVEYQLVSGERRLRASKLLGLKTVPVIVRRMGLDKEKLSIALIENIQRADLNPIETARAYSRLQDEFGLTQREVATKVGKNRATVANTLRLLGLPSDIQDAVSEGKLNESQARSLLSIKDPQEQNKVFHMLLENKISTKKLRSYKSKNKVNKKENNSQKRENNFWEKQLEEKLSAPVKIQKKGEKGKMIIQFFSKDDWKKLLDKFLND
ncbi:MAG: ParB/RepB/Spo0J family partition protein [Candidatus Paceibacterota bacterium]